MPGGRLLALALADPASGGPRTAAFVSGFLARLLLDPPSEAVLMLGRRADLPPTHDGLDARVGAVARLLGEADPTDLAREWTRLFVGPRAAPCRPWHDTWDFEGVPRLRGPRHTSMVTFWGRAGLQPTHLETEPADHAGLILALVSALAARAAEDDDVEGVSALLGELWAAHVAPWLPRFAATLVAEARVPALGAAGELLRDAVGAP